jgi:hypothetical protein
MSASDKAAIATTLCVILSILLSLGARSYVGAVASVIAAYLLLRLGFSIFGMIEEYARGYAFERGWFANLIGQLVIPVLVVTFLQYRKQKKAQAKVG